MTSPFPGMDPYLERHWRDVHSRSIVYISDLLQRRLPVGLRARVEERIFVEAPAGADRPIAPDVRVFEHPGAGRRRVVPGDGGEGGVAIAVPIIVRMPVEEVTETFVQILDVASGGRVVTAIEILSASNKRPGRGQDLYVEKQEELRQGGVSLVEVDLLRAGKRVMVVPPALVPASHRTAYQVCVRRGWRGDLVEIYRALLRERLPVIPVPLREADPDVSLDLQALIDLCYANGGYEDTDYTAPPDPPLDPDDDAWADELLRSKGLR